MPYLPLMEVPLAASVKRSVVNQLLSVAPKRRSERRAKNPRRLSLLQDYRRPQRQQRANLDLEMDQDYWIWQVAFPKVYKCNTCEQILNIYSRDERPTWKELHYLQTGIPYVYVCCLMRHRCLTVSKNLTHHWILLIVQLFPRVIRASWAGPVDRNNYPLSEVVAALQNWQSRYQLNQQRGKQPYPHQQRVNWAIIHFINLRIII